MVEIWLVNRKTVRYFRFVGFDLGGDFYKSENLQMELNNSCMCVCVCVRCLIRAISFTNCLKSTLCIMGVELLFFLYKKGGILMFS